MRRSFEEFNALLIFILGFVQCDMEINAKQEVIKNISNFKSKPTSFNIIPLPLDKSQDGQEIKFLFPKWQKLSMAALRTKESLAQQRGFLSQNISLDGRNSRIETANDIIRNAESIQFNGEQNRTDSFYLHTLRRRRVDIEEYHIGNQENLSPIFENVPTKQKSNKLLLQHRLPSRKKKPKRKKMRHRAWSGRRRETKTRNETIWVHAKYVPAFLEHLTPTQRIVVIIAAVVGGLAFSSTVSCVVYRCFRRKKIRKDDTKTNDCGQDSNNSETDEDNDGNETYSEEESSPSDGDYNLEDDHYEVVEQKLVCPSKSHENETQSKNKGEECKSKQELKRNKRFRGDKESMNLHQMMSGDAERSNKSNVVVNYAKQKELKCNEMGKNKTVLSSNSEGDRTTSSHSDHDNYSDQCMKDIVQQLPSSIYTSTNKKYSFSDASFVPSSYYLDSVNYNLALNNVDVFSGGDVHQKDLKRAYVAKSREKLADETLGIEIGKSRIKSEQRKSDRGDGIDVATNANRILMPLTEEMHSQNAARGIFSKNFSHTHQTKDKRAHPKRFEAIPLNSSYEDTEAETTEDSTKGSGNSENNRRQATKRRRIIKSTMIQSGTKEERGNDLPRPLQSNIPKLHLSRSKTEECLKPIRKCASDSQSMDIGTRRFSNFFNIARNISKKSCSREEVKPLLSEKRLK